MRVCRTRDSPSNEVLRARTKPRFVRRQIFERPRNGKRKMRYSANTNRIHYPEKKCIRTKLDTCEKSFCCCQQPIRFGEIWRFECRNDVRSSRNRSCRLLSRTITQSYFLVGRGDTRSATQPKQISGNTVAWPKRGVF